MTAKWIKPTFRDAEHKFVKDSIYEITQKTFEKYKECFELIIEKKIKEVK